ncbi:MAG: radical SAM family heme chaperone HemW [Armatimonadota bacterium]|nr:MAG: radical SAM family heme chaperone HemW [Armatimonadota bacterium]
MSAEHLGIYVHVPFCTGKCPYCSFDSRPATDGEIEAYVPAVSEEVRLRLDGDAAAGTVYFGGGTPTMLRPALLGELLRAIEVRLPLADDVEITVEANPESLTRDSLAELRRVGFNRLSIGAQSFDDEVLSTLGRRHDARRAREAVQDARGAGWENVSLDLIFGVPGQGQRQWRATLEQAMSLRAEHISTYCLTIEPGTEFHRRQLAGDLVGVGEETEAEMYAAARHMLLAAGYEHYEISNFALPGRRCRHNEKYWRDGDYVGLGAGAHSSVRGLRWANTACPGQYRAMVRRGVLPVAYVERLAARRRMDEGLILELRTVEGSCLAQLGARCGRDAVNEYRNHIEELVRAGLATMTGSRLALTERGMLLASEVGMRIMA